MQPPHGINFLVMEDQNEYGATFETALKESQDWTPTTLAAELGVNPQRIQHWKKRGVSARYAHAVATLIEVSAGSISKLKVTQNTGKMKPETTSDEEAVLDARFESMIRESSPEADIRAIKRMLQKASADEADEYIRLLLDRLRSLRQESQ